LLVTFLFQPHKHILAASQNNTDEGANGCIGLQCQIVVDDEADLFIEYQQATGSSRMLAGVPKPVTPPTSNGNKQASGNCNEPDKLYSGIFCTG
ncbi:hypothetical protein A2U01_0038298, partial [Trifolium medium]|nr:hypothetical protein [Trifolium medium]